MRICLRCNTEMVDNLFVTVKGSPYEIEISSNKHWLFATDVIGAPKAAVCPNCGEISFYLADKSAIGRKGRKKCT